MIFKLIASVGLLFILWIPLSSFAQVGIGTTNPSAELDISTSSTGIPALELTPQTSPTGSTTGQLAVIGDMLYMYDATRGKWLSVESTPLQFGYALGADDQALYFGGDIGYDTSTENDTGAKMPFDGTIIRITVESSGGNTSKSFDLMINGVAVGDNTNPTLDGRFSLSLGTFSYTSFNINFNAGDYIMLKARSLGSAVNDPTDIIWVKWRK